MKFCRQCGSTCPRRHFVITHLDEFFCKLPCALAFVRENEIDPVPGLVQVVVPASGS